MVETRKRRVNNVAVLSNLRRNQKLYSSGSDIANGPTFLAVSKTLVTASTRYSEVTSLFRDDPPIAWYLAIWSAAIAGKPRYIGTDGRRPLPSAAECSFVKTLWAMLGKKRNNK